MTRHIILTDIDGTLANADWRESLAGAWDEYHRLSATDEPHGDVVDLIRALSRAGYEVIGLTTRPEKWRQLTMAWLFRHDIPLDDLIMRPDDDWRPAPEVKAEQVSARFDQSNILCILDDRDDIAARFHGMGLTALQVFARRG